MLTVERTQELLNRFGELRVLVAGDLMLDEFLWGNVSRISPEAPVPVVEVTGQSFYAGGAANVARNLAEFSKGVGVMGLCGGDEQGAMLRKLLQEAGMDVAGIVEDPMRRTILKTRVVARHQQVVRIDRESKMTPTAEQCDALLARLEEMLPKLDAIILSDYAKGFLTQAFVSALCQGAARLSRIVTVDPSPRNPILWEGVTAVKPNLKEARAAAGLGEDADCGEAGAALLKQWGAGMVLITMGEHGMELFRPGRAAYHTPTRAREVFDVSGAGDTAIALFTLGLAAGATPEEAAELANHASGVAVGKLGTATVTPQELLESASRMAAMDEAG
jgi:D-glycero-beta-D-manno-heptose-7-phosphate kinase